MVQFNGILSDSFPVCIHKRTWGADCITRPHQGQCKYPHAKAPLHGGATNDGTRWGAAFKMLWCAGCCMEAILLRRFFFCVGPSRLLRTHDRVLARFLTRPDFPVLLSVEITQILLRKHHFSKCLVMISELFTKAQRSAGLARQGMGDRQR
jgi:hypothetical protein